MAHGNGKTTEEKEKKINLIPLFKSSIQVRRINSQAGIEVANYNLQVQYHFMINCQHSSLEANFVNIENVRTVSMLIYFDRNLWKYPK